MEELESLRDRYEKLEQENERLRSVIPTAIRYVQETTGLVSHDQGRLALVILAEKLQAAFGESAKEKP